MSVPRPPLCVVEQRTQSMGIASRAYQQIRFERTSLDHKNAANKEIKSVAN